LNSGLAPRILLVYPSSYYLPRSTSRDEVKAATFTLGSYLSRFFPVKHVDLEIEIGRPETRVLIGRFERRVREFLEQEDYDILALSCWTSLSYQATMAVARQARAIHPKRLIVVGGYHPTARPENFLTSDNLIDYVVRGEGELAFREIATSFADSRRPAQTEVVVGKSLFPGDFVDLNWALVDDTIKSSLEGKVGTLCVFLSRGCPFECSFCMESLKDKCWRPYPPERAIDQIRTITERYPVQAVALGDACFGVRPQWRKEFLRRLLDLKPSCWILLETRPEYLDEEDIKILSQLKVEIQMGVESASPQMLKLMNKTKQPERFLEEFREVSGLLSEHEIVHGANLIFNHPGETQETIEETFAFVDSVARQGQGSLMWACHGYMHFPGSQIDHNRSYYEQQFGAVFLNPEWWLEDSNPFVASRQVIPSRDLTGERVDLWRSMFVERVVTLKAAMTDKAFRLAAESYFPRWAADQRYARITGGDQ
jgi:uncharacterized Fe-S cluster-containing radical SAM superfamily protein